jgi:hypothetical protein
MRSGDLGYRAARHMSDREWLPVGAGATGIVKDSKDLEARLPVKFRETPVRWHIDRSAIRTLGPPLGKLRSRDCPV